MLSCVTPCLVVTDRVNQIEKPTFIEDHLLQRGQMLGPKRKMRPEQIEDVLSTLRNRTCVIEAPLKDVLTHPKKYRKDFGNANQLLSEVRTQYIYLFRPFHINDVYYIIPEIKNYQININKYFIIKFKMHSVIQNNN